MPLRATRTDIFVATITTFLFGSYDAFEENLTHMKIINLKTYLGENVTDFCAEILVDADCLESAGAFKPDHIGYITRIFEDTSDSRFFCGLFKSTRRLQSLSRNFVCVTWISYHKRSS